MLSRSSVQFMLYFMRAYPFRTALMVGLLIFAGLAEGFGLVTILPAIEFATQPDLEEPQSAIGRAMAGLLAGVGLEATLPLLLAMIVAFIALKGGFLWLAMRQAGYTIAHVATTLRLTLIRALLNARWSHFSSQSVGHFANAISSEAHRASSAYGESCQVLTGVVHILTYAVLAFLVSWKIALLAVFGGVSLVMVFGRLVGMSRRAGAEQTELVKSLVGQLTDILHGIKPIKAMGAEEQITPLLEREAHELNEARMRQVLAHETMRHFQEPLLVAMLAVGLVGAVTVGNQPFSSLLVLAFLFYRLVGRVSQMQSQYQAMAGGESAFWSLRNMILAAEAEPEEKGGTVQPGQVRSSIRLDAVSFSYGQHPVLRDVSLEAQPGQFVAISGASGAGKTTIADLVVGLLRPDSGEVFIDNVPLKEVDIAAWHRKIGYVPQEMFLLHDSVYGNVTIGDDAITEQDAREALESAGAWDFVSKLSEGIHTIVGERGSKLSGGQRQRIAIARALARKPALLVLDEVTTALDPVTEAAICETLRGLRNQTTILAISHQPAIIRSADVVYELEEGRIRSTQPAARLA